MSNKDAFVYILTNKNNTTLYTGVTSDLQGRVWEHKNNFYPRSFSARYKLYKLIYYEAFGSIDYAIAREKEIKGKSRAYKESLINEVNPSWRDLGPSIKGW